MIRFCILLSLVLCSCSTVQQNNKQEEKAATADSTFIVKIDSLNTLVEVTDTTFLFKEKRKGYYHAVFIEPDKNSKFYKWLTNFSFDEFDSSSYNSLRERMEEKNPGVYKSFTMEELPQNWLPLYQYKNKFYLYSPSDGGAACKRIINKKEFIYWYMMGPASYPLSSVRRPTKNKYELLMLDPFQDSSSVTLSVNIHIIDPITKMAVFEHMEEKGLHRYALYVPVESADKFDMVINYCTTQKQDEYEFEKIDFQKLLSKNKK